MKPKLKKTDKVLRSVRPNAGFTAVYRAKLDAAIKAMHESVMYWVRAKYRANEPAVLAVDEAPALVLRREMRRLGRQWQKAFNRASPKLARYFSTSVSKRTDAALKSILKEGGFSVEFRMTPAMQDVLQATIGQQVGLIKSIPQKYLTEVEGMVMQSVQTGRDLEILTKQLQKTYGVTRRRAALISRDQNNKATSAMTHARQTELGIGKAIWMHSHAGKEPRPTHVKMNGTAYNVSEGLYDEDEGRNVFPGELINCRCTARPVIAGLT